MDEYLLPIRMNLFHIKWTKETHLSVIRQMALVDKRQRIVKAI